MIVNSTINLHEDIVKKQPDIQYVIHQNQQCTKLLDSGYVIEAIHEYTDIEGNACYYKVRLKNPVTNQKSIRPVHSNGTKWLWKEPVFHGFKPLYNLFAIASNPDATIWICEGEKSADHLNEFFKKLNIYDANIATTSGGAGSANSVDWSILAQHKIIIWPDNDEAGTNYCNAVIDKLLELDAAISIVDITPLELPKKGDVVDWLNALDNTGEAEFDSIQFVAPEPKYQPLFDISDASVLKFIKNTPPPRVYLLSDCLPLGKVGLLVGMGGVRKSQFMLQLQIAIATGKPFCGHWHIESKGSSLGLYAEEDNDELHRRFHYLVEKFNNSDKELVAERVLIQSMSGMDKHLTSKSGFDTPSVSDIAYKLIITANQIPNLKLIVIDPVSRFNGGEENSSADMTSFVEACEMVSKATGASVIIVHHVNKASINATDITQAAARGSSALSDGVRWQMNMNVMADKEAKSLNVPDSQRKSFVKVEVTKNNYAPPQSLPVWLELTKPHGILNYVELTHAGENKKIETLSKVIEKIKENASKGIEQSKSAFSKQYAGTDNIFKTGDKSLRGLIEQAIEEGLLVLSPPKFPIKNVSEVLVVAHQEPKLNYSNEYLSSQL